MDESLLHYYIPFSFSPGLVFLVFTDFLFCTCFCLSLCFSFCLCFLSSFYLLLFCPPYSVLISSSMCVCLCVFLLVWHERVARDKHENTPRGCDQFITVSLYILVQAEWVGLLVFCIIMLTVHKHRHTLIYTAGSLVKQSLDTFLYPHTPMLSPPWCAWQTPTSRRLYETLAVHTQSSCRHNTPTQSHTGVTLKQKSVSRPEQLNRSVLTCNCYGLLL